MMNDPTEQTLETTACQAPVDCLRIGNDEALALAAAFKAIGHPVRLQILELLSRNNGQFCVCEVEACFELSQPTISHHLRVLREAGLVSAEQRGLWAYYQVRRERVEPLRALLDGWIAASAPR